MKFSVVIPCLNQAEFLERCLYSVVSEKREGHNLEIIVMDGGSTDGSVEVIKRFNKYIDYWRSRPDEGQAAAIAEGFEISEGNYLTWLNADDCWEKGVLRVVTEAIEKYGSDLIIGDTKIIDTEGNLIRFCRAKFVSIRAMVLIGAGFSQPSVFFSRSLYRSVGGIRKDLQCAFDHVLFLKMLEKTKPLIIHKCFSQFRWHGQNKTIKLREVMTHELRNIHQEYIYTRYPLFLKKFWQIIYRIKAGILDRYGYLLYKINTSLL